MPVLPQSLGWLKRVVLAFLDSRYDDPVERKHILLAFTNHKAFQEALAIDDSTQMHALLVDRAGQIRWRSAGAWTPSAQSELRAALDLRLAASPRLEGTP